MDGQTLRRQHTRTKHEPSARWSSRMSLCGHRDRAIGLMAGGREGNWLEKECGDGHREALGLTFSSPAQPSGQGGRRARGYSPHGRCSRRGAKQRTVTPAKPTGHAAGCSGNGASASVVRFRQILEVRMLAANGNTDISFDYMRLFTKYSKIMQFISDQDRSV